MVAQKWGSTAAVVTLTTTDVSFSNNANYHQTAGADLIIDNSANKEIYLDFEIVGTFANAPGDGGLVRVWLLNALDGTNYPDGGTVTPPIPHTFALPVRSVTTSQRITVERIDIGPSKYKVVLRNEAGQAINAGAVLKYKAYSFDG